MTLCLRVLRQNAGQTYWAEHDVQIESDDSFDQLGMRFALYHLNIMIKRDDDRVGIGAKGMTGEGYKGHSFWDTEMFLMPHYLFTDPAAATHPAGLPLAQPARRVQKGQRRTAIRAPCSPGRAHGWTTAKSRRFSARADVVTGQSIPVLTGMLEQHITADIAWAVWLYYQATGDDDFMNRRGCELLIEIARFWASRARVAG